MGYGDKVPTTILGRVIACIWMVIGIILFGIFNAAIVMVVSVPPTPYALTGPRDPSVAGMSICTTKGSFEEWIRVNGLVDATYFADDVTVCYDQLAQKEVGHRISRSTACPGV